MKSGAAFPASVNSDSQCKPPDLALRRVNTNSTIFSRRLPASQNLFLSVTKVKEASTMVRNAPKQTKYSRDIANAESPTNSITDRLGVKERLC